MIKTGCKGYPFSPHGSAVRVRSPPTAGGGFNGLARLARTCARAVMRLLFLQGGASRGDCPRSRAFFPCGVGQCSRVRAVRRTGGDSPPTHNPHTLRAGAKKRKRPTGVGRFGNPPRVGRPHKRRCCCAKGGQEPAGTSARRADTRDTLQQVMVKDKKISARLRRAGPLSYARQRA